MGLEKCKLAEDFIHLLHSVPIASSQTFVVADAQGNGMLIECSSNDLEVISLAENRLFACSTNMFHTNKMKKYNHLPEDTWQAEERYSVMTSYLAKTANHFDLKKAQSLLAGEQGFLCQYDRTTGKDTVWSVIYDVPEGGIYRVEGNPSRKAFKKDERFLIQKS